MPPPNRVLKRSFTQAARDRACAVRRENALNRQDIATPQVFVVRRTSLSGPFAWEIRRFGGLILQRSDVGFSDMTLARTAGAEALQRMVAS